MSAVKDEELAYSQRSFPEIDCNDRCEARWALYPFCRWMGKTGSDCFESMRVPILWACVVLQTIALVFFCVGMAGVSTETSVIKSCAWAELHAGGIDAYMNYKAIRVEYSSSLMQDYTQKLEDIQNNNDTVAKSFQPCNDASDEVLFNMVCTVVMAAMWPYQSWNRIRFDHGCSKFNCTLGIAMQIVFTWIAIAQYQTHCINDVSDRLNSSGLASGDLVPGPGFILCWLGCFLEMFTGTVHMILKSPIPMQYGPVKSESCCNIEFERNVTLGFCCPHVEDTVAANVSNPSGKTETQLEPPGAKTPDSGVQAI